MNDNAGFPANLEAPAGEVIAAPSPQPGPFFERTDWQSFWVTTVIGLAVYLFTLCPSIELGFSGILTTAAQYAGVPHPPGFPLWTIYAQLFTALLPISNTAWRVSVSSAFAGAVACGLIALLVSHIGVTMLEGLRDFQRLDAKAEKWLRLISGYAAGMSFGLSDSVWSHCVIPDWWPLNFMLLAATLCLLARWSYAPGKNRYLYTAILFYGPTLANSRAPCLEGAAPGIVLFIMFVHPALARDICAVAALLLIHFVFVTRDSFTPMLWRIYVSLMMLAMVLAVVFAIKTRKIFAEWKALLGCSFCLALGLSLCFYSPIASMTNPPMNWGYPRTVQGFFHLISRGQYERLYPTNDWGRFFQQIGLYWKIVLSDYGWLYLLPAGIPFIFLHRLRNCEHKIMFGLIALFLCMSIFLVAILNLSFDKESRELQKILFTPSYIILALWTGWGLILLGTMLTRRRSVPG